MGTDDKQTDTTSTDDAAPVDPSSGQTQDALRELIAKQERTAARLERLLTREEEGGAPAAPARRHTFWLSAAILVLTLGVVLGVNELRSQVHRLHNQVRTMDAMLRRQATEQTKAAPDTTDGVVAHVDAAVEAFRQELRTAMDSHRDDVVAREKILNRREAVVEHKTEAAEARIDAVSQEREVIIDRAIGELNDLADGLSKDSP